MSPPFCLVALEDPVERSRVASLAWSHGFEVRQVSSADMALRILRRGRPIDLAIIESAELVTRARCEELTTPFLVVSPPGFEPTGSHTGRVRFVEWPLDETQLAGLVPALVDHRTRETTVVGSSP